MSFRQEWDPSTIDSILSIDSGCRESMPCQHMVTYMKNGERKCHLMYSPDIWATLEYLDFPFEDGVVTRALLEHFIHHASSREVFDRVEQKWLGLYGQTPSSVTLSDPYVSALSFHHNPSVTYMMERCHKASNTFCDMKVVRCGDTFTLENLRALVKISIEKQGEDDSWISGSLFVNENLIMTVYPELLEETDEAYLVDLNASKLFFGGKEDRPFTLCFKLRGHTSPLPPLTCFHFWGEDWDSNIRHPAFSPREIKVFLPSYEIVHLDESGAAEFGKDYFVRSVFVQDSFRSTRWKAIRITIGEEEPKIFPRFALEKQGKCFVVPFGIDTKGLTTPMGRHFKEGGTLKIELLISPEMFITPPYAFLSLTNCVSIATGCDLPFTRPFRFESQSEQYDVPLNLHNS